MKYFQKIIAVLLVIVLLICSIPNIFAATTASDLNGFDSYLKNKMKETVLDWLSANGFKTITAQTIPGINYTCLNGKVCDCMTPQGMVYDETYQRWLITAYCGGEHGENASPGKHNSAVYALKNGSVQTFDLNTDSHVGGIAIQNSKIYIAGNRCTILEYPNKSSLSFPANTKTYTTTCHPSFVTAYNGYLYYGNFYDDTTTVIYCLNPNTGKNTKAFQLTGITGIQGLSIRGGGMYVSANTGRIYVLEYKNGTNGTLTNLNIKYYFEVPAYNEQPYDAGDYLYLLFESGSIKYRNTAKRPTDSFLALSKKEMRNKYTATSCTRAEAIAFLYFSLNRPKTDEKMKFTDIPSKAYYYDAVKWAGVTNVATGTVFNPNNILNRGQAVTFLWRAAGSPAPKITTTKFTDVDPSRYYYKAMLWAVENGITNGTSATTFSPDQVCTKTQMITFLSRINWDKYPNHK